MWDDEEAFLGCLLQDSRILAFMKEDNEDIVATHLLGISMPDDSAIEVELLRAAQGDYDSMVEEDDDNSAAESVEEDSSNNSIPTGRGHRGPRQSRWPRSPYRSTFWMKYIKPAIEASTEDPDSVWHEDSHQGQIFRRRFGVPYVMFNDICRQWKETGEYREERNYVGHICIDARLLILGCFRILTKGLTFDLIDEATDISYQHVHSFLINLSTGLSTNTKRQS